MYAQHIRAAPSNKFPVFQGVSPRVTAQTYQSHRGEYVSIIFELTGPGEFKCGATGMSVKVVGVPEAVEVSRVCEFICYVDPSTGELTYFQHAMLDDEFDFEVYRRLVSLTTKVPQLF
ncbi:Replication factor A protein 3 [Leishmania braziliensis]|nr:Replication factor A protein 3 [Leishmania braziliensis]